MSIQERIQQQITEQSIVLYMKGTKETPMCGFSAKVVAILSSYNVDFIAYNVLEDDALRQGIKEFSDWPTIPQLYVRGEFVGGCDIVSELHQQGELAALLAA